MRIALSLLALRPGQVGGAETYVRQMVEYLPQVSPGDEFVLVVDRDVDGRGRGARLAQAGRSVLRPPGRGPAGARGLHALEGGRAGGGPSRHSARTSSSSRSSRSSRPGSRRPSVLTVVDVQYLFHPENFGPFDRTFRPRVYPRSLRAARHVIAISEFTRRTLIEACAVAPEKVTAVPLGFTPSDMAGVEPYPIGAPYLYYPAATFPHKDTTRSCGRCPRSTRRGELRHRLVLTGARTRHWKAAPAPRPRAGLEGVRASTGGSSPASRWTRSTRARRRWSSRAGTRASGCRSWRPRHFGKRIVTSRLPVFDEIGVPARLQIDFGNPEALLAALRDPGPWSLLRRPNTWMETAARSLDVLRSVARSSTPA